MSHILSNSPQPFVSMPYGEDDLGQGWGQAQGCVRVRVRVRGMPDSGDMEEALAALSLSVVFGDDTA